jgi:hypothetical protein
MPVSQVPSQPGLSAEGIAAGQWPRAGEDQVQRAIGELLKIMPEDVLEEIRQGTIDLHDPAFLEGLTDHVSRLAVANPQRGRALLGKLIRLKKMITRSVRQAEPEAVVSATVAYREARVGRNAPCPCGSGRKYKQCCMRKAASASRTPPAR